MIGLEKTITLIDFFSKHIYYDSLSGKGIIIYIEQMKMEVGSGMLVLSLSYMKYDGIVTNVQIYILWEVI